MQRNTNQNKMFTQSLNSCFSIVQSKTLPGLNDARYVLSSLSTMKNQLVNRDNKDINFHLFVDIDRISFLQKPPIYSPLQHGIRRYSTKASAIIPEEQIPITGEAANPEATRSLAEAMRSLDLYDHREAYKSKTFTDLLRAFVIIRLCSFDVLVRHQLKLLKMTRFVLRGPLFRALMRRTLYAQFMAGESRDAVLRNITNASKYGILPLLGFTAAEVHGDSWALKKHGTDQEMYNANVQSLKDSFLIGRDCKEWLDACVAGTLPRCTGKLTYLRPHACLITATSLIEHNRQFVTKNTDPVVTATIRDIANQLAPGRDTDVHGLLMNMDFHFALYEAFQHSKAYNLDINITECKNAIREIEDVLEDLAKCAVEAGVCVVWDAEQTYLQAAIDVLVIDSMRKHNTARVVVYNTYQCYLKKTLGNIERDAGIAEKEGFTFGAKVVRGAYMDEERRLAVKKDYEDPICDNYEGTTASYYGVGDFLIRELKQRPRGHMHVIFGSHNDKTILYLLDRMQAVGLENNRDLFWLAQVYGMKDYIAFPISQAQLPAGKLMQYGGIEEGIAYLSRRVSENRHALDIESGKVECGLLSKEIKRRMWPQAKIPAAKVLQYGGIDEGIAYLSRRVNENRHALDIESGKVECSLLGKEIKRRTLRQT